MDRQIGIYESGNRLYFPTSQALENPEWTEDGIISIKTKDFDNTTSHKQKFSVDGKKVSVFLVSQEQVLGK